MPTPKLWGWQLLSTAPTSVCPSPAKTRHCTPRQELAGPPRRGLGVAPKRGGGFRARTGGGGGGLPGVRCTHPNPVLGNLVRLVIKVRPAAGKRWLTGWYGVAKQGCDILGFGSVDNGWTANMSACNIIPQILQLRKMRRIPSGQQLICSDSKNSRAYLQPGGGGCSVRLLDGRHPGR